MMTQLSLRRLPPLLSSCAMGLALSTLAGASAHAQVAAFQGTGTFAAGLGTIDSSGGTAAAPVTNVTIIPTPAPTTTAVIDWTPTDTDPTNPAAIDFLPANGTVNFNSGGAYTVLNRILTPTSRPIGLNGAVLGTVTPVSSPTQVGGDIWFYSPTGIIAGSGSSFSANGLIFTANDIPFTPGAGGGLTVGPGVAIPFTAAAGSQAGVVIQPGATITTATGGSSYVALIAPRVVQGGTITIDGSVALVAAEAANITINNGLFDIQLVTGTTVPDAITTSGQTGLAPGAAVTVTGAQKVYVAALPKNTAITLLLGGTLGTAAANASTANRAVILSGGYDVLDASGTGLGTTSNSTDAANIQIGTSDFAAALTAAASGTITGSPARSEVIHFEEDASLTGALGSTLTADLDEQILADKNLSLFSPVSAQIMLRTVNSQAGAVDNPAVLKVGGDLVIDASNSASVVGQSATGGFASLQIDGGAVGPNATISGNITVLANGNGASSAGAGGDGIGGTAQLLIGSGTLTANDVTIQADGNGGTTDGSGIGGTARFVNQGTAPIPDGRKIGALTLSANGNSGGFGGNSIGGFVQLSNLATGPNGGLEAASIFAQAFGLAPPASGTGALIENANNPLNLDGDFSVDAAGTVTVAVTGGGTISTPGTASLSSSFGDVVITHASQTQPLTPTISANSIFIDADQNVRAGTGTLLFSGDSISVLARNADIAVDSLTAVTRIDLHALHNVSVNNAITTALTAPAIDSSILIDITAGIDPVTFDSAYLPFDIVVSGTVSTAGPLFAHAGRDIIGLGASRLEGQSVQLVGERDISGANLAITSQRNLDIFVGRNLLAGTVDVTGTINMIDALEQPVQTGILSVPGSLSIGSLILRDPTPGLLRAGGDLTIGTARTTSLDVASTSGTVTVSGLTSFPTGPSGFLNATAPSISLGGITVSGDVTATATGTLTITGPVGGATIRASSGDIVIAPGGSLGAAGQTTLVELTNSNAAKRSFFGGADNPAGYSLSGAEIGRLFGDAITLIAPQTPQSSAASPDVTIGALTVSSRAGNPSGQLGAQGAFTIQTNGRVAVNGAVGMTGAGAGNSFVIRAGESIAIDNLAGLIDLRGANNALAGTIDLSANTILAASSAAQQALAGTTDIAAINARLGIRDGAVNEQGVLRADAIRLTVTNGLYIQNTGGNAATSLRRGFTVGAGGLAVSTRSASAQIVINGQATNGTGGIATGLDAIPLVRINGQPAPSSSGSAAGSTINGCIFSNVAACPNIPVILPDEATPTRDRLHASVDPPTNTPLDQPLTVPSIQIDDIGRFDYEPLIDEPVTGSGNDDLWIPGCDQGKQGSCSLAP